MGGPFLPFVEGALEGIDLLDIRRTHVERGHELPLLHRDPFDRILVAQALAEGFTLLTVDHSLPAYGAGAIAVALAGYACGEATSSVRGRGSWTTVRGRLTAASSPPMQTP